MRRGSYAKSLTGQVPGNLPLLKPPVAPFRKWSTLRATPSTADTGITSLLAEIPGAKDPETVAASPLAPRRSNGVPEISAGPAESGSPATNALAARFAPAPNSPRHIDTKKEPEKPISNSTELMPLPAERSSNLKTAAVEVPKVSPATPSLSAISYRAKQDPKAKENERDANSLAATSTSADQRPPVSFLSSKYRTEISAPTVHDEGVPASQLSSGNRRPDSSPLPAKFGPELQSPRNSAGNATLRLEPNIPPRPALPAREPTQQSQTSGGVHIGTLEVRIVPAPAPPVIKPRQSQPAPTAVLSRSFASSLGLIQG